jgi:hypothetical protein
MFVVVITNQIARRRIFSSHAGGLAAINDVMSRAPQSKSLDVMIVNLKGFDAYRSQACLAQPHCFHV